MLDRRSFVFTVALDLQAAFDTLNHEVLLHICEDRFGIRYAAIKWLQSYLLGRKQLVLVNDSVAKPAFLDSGVPQGSILGPMLFSVYLTPLGDLLKEIKVNYQLYADDTLLYFECSSKHIFNANSVEITIQKVLYWFANAGQQFNENKTEAILISSVKNAPSISSIKVGNVEVKLSNSLKCLGITVDKHLDMDKQVKTVAKNCFYYLRKLHSLQNFVDFETRIVLVRCLIMSRLDYCNSILNGLGMKKLSILQRVQNRACRFVYRLHPWCSVSIHTHDLHWLSIYMRIRFKILLFVYKSFFRKDLIPDYLDVFEKRAKTSRNGVVLVVPKRSSKLGRDAFDYQGSVLWNKLPKWIREQNGVDQFKSALKTFLFREHFYS